MQLKEKLSFKVVNIKEDYQSCLAIRRKVFVEEQSVAPEIEVDDLESVAVHFIGFLENVPVCTARLVKINDTAVKIGRVAVLKELRGQGIGKLLMQEIIDYSRQSGISSLLLASQTHALDFYKKLGFKAYGNEFFEANISHYMMRLDF